MPASGRLLEETDSVCVYMRKGVRAYVNICMYCVNNTALGWQSVSLRYLLPIFANMANNRGTQLDMSSCRAAVTSSRSRRRGAREQSRARDACDPLSLSDVVRGHHADLRARPLAPYANLQERGGRISASLLTFGCSQMPTRLHHCVNASTLASLPLGCLFLFFPLCGTPFLEVCFFCCRLNT